MEPGGFSRFISSNTPSRPSHDTVNIPLQPIPSAKLPVSPTAIDTTTAKTMKQIADLQEQLAMKNKEYVIMLSDAELFGEAQQRPYFNEWFNKMLGTNRELDDLRAVEREVKKFRETIQKRLDHWREEYKIVISLEQELKRGEVEKPSTVTEYLALMAADMERDLKNIFQQIEDNFKNTSFQLEEKKGEVEKVLEKLASQDTLLKKLFEELELYKIAVDKQNVLKAKYEQLVVEHKQNLKGAELALSELAKAKKRYEEVSVKVSKLQELLIESETAHEKVKAEKIDLQHRLKRAEDELAPLKESEQERKYLFDCLDKSQKSLAEARNQLRIENLKRTKVIEEADDSANSFMESSLIESSRLRKERLLKEEISLENEGLRLKCATLEEILQKGKDESDVMQRNAMMIRFINDLPDEYRRLFHEKFQAQFQK